MAVTRFFEWFTQSRLLGRRLGLAGFLLCGILIAGGVTPASAAGDPPDVVANRWTAAVSAGDIERALALCDDNVSFTVQYTLNGRVVPMGKWGLAIQRASMASPAAKGGTSRLISTEVNGTKVVARIEGASPFLKSLGVDRTLNTTTMDVRDGKIVSAVIDFDVADAETARYLAAIKVYPPVTPAPPNTGNAMIEPGSQGEPHLALVGLVLVTIACLGYVVSGARRHQSNR